MSYDRDDYSSAAWDKERRLRQDQEFAKYVFFIALGLGLALLGWLW
jgi:hypothetical protein